MSTPLDLDSMPADSQVRMLDALLRRELGLPSPLEEAVKLLDGAAGLDFQRTVLANQARIERQKLARGIALGEITFDDHAIGEFDTLAWHLPTVDQQTPTARALVEYVNREATYEAYNRMVTSSGPIWDALVVEARKCVERLEALPEPPRGLFIHPNPVDELARTEEHASTLSVLLTAGARFDVIHRAAEFVRDQAGHGVERFPDGAPRSAGVYRNWRRMFENQSDLATVHRQMRLWWTVRENWQPGLWAAKDIDKPTAAENTFGRKLARLGSATQ